MTETEAADALTAVLDGVRHELHTTRATYTPRLLTSIHELIDEASNLALRLEGDRR
jgi:hypothetical protein